MVSTLRRSTRRRTSTAAASGRGRSRSPSPAPARGRRRNAAPPLSSSSSSSSSSSESDDSDSSESEDNEPVMSRGRARSRDRGRSRDRVSASSSCDNVMKAAASVPVIHRSCYDSIWIVRKFRAITAWIQALLSPWSGTWTHPTEFLAVSWRVLKQWAARKCWYEWLKFALLVVVIVAFAPNPIWAARIQFPNFMKTFQPRFLDMSQPYPTFVYDGAYPSILNVPVLERAFWYTCRLPQFLFWSLAYRVPAAFDATFNWHTQPIADAEWIEMWSDLWPSRFLKSCDGNSAVLGREPWSLEPELMTKAAGRENARYWAAEFGVMGYWAYDQGMYGADSKVLFRRASGEQDLEPVAIWLGKPFIEGSGLVVLPGDSAWEGAKTFALHGAIHYEVLSSHPMIHFPMDTVNGLTKNHKFIPAYHAVRTMLMPHFRLTLSLEDAVMNDWILSILLNPYFLHCFDTSAETKIFFTAMEGWKHYDFQKMRTELHLTDRPSRYSEFVESYRPIFTKFIDAVVTEMGPASFIDEHTARWADEIGSYLNGFPSGDKFRVSDMSDTQAVEQAVTELKATLENIMFDLSVVHAFDHYSYATQIPLNKAPWRLRAPPPQSRKQAWDFRKGSASWYDYFLFYTVNKVFFFFGPWDTVANVDYGFSTPELQAIQTSFKAELRAHDAMLKEKRKQEMPLSLIGPSIDY